MGVRRVPHTMYIEKAVSQGLRHCLYHALYNAHFALVEYMVADHQALASVDTAEMR